MPLQFAQIALGDKKSDVLRRMDKAGLSAAAYIMTEYVMSAEYVTYPAAG
jgi:hypothetical protein